MPTAFSTFPSSLKITNNHIKHPLYITALYKPSTMSEHCTIVTSKKGNCTWLAVDNATHAQLSQASTDTSTDANVKANSATLG